MLIMQLLAVSCTWPAVRVFHPPSGTVSTPWWEAGFPPLPPSQPAWGLGTDPTHIHNLQPWRPGKFAHKQHSGRQCWLGLCGNWERHPHILYIYNLFRFPGERGRKETWNYLFQLRTQGFFIYKVSDPLQSRLQLQQILLKILFITEKSNTGIFM